MKVKGGCKATWKRKFKLPWREAGPPKHHDDKVDSDKQVVNKEFSLCRKRAYPEAQATHTGGTSSRLGVYPE